jgi:hypothetical protein
LDVIQTGGGSGTATAALFRAGNNSDYYGNNQIIFGYSGTVSYSHAIKSRHQSGAASGNAIDFYLWQNGQSAGAVGSLQAMTIENNAGSIRVGIGTSTAAYTLDVSGTGRFTNTLNLTGGSSSNDNVRFYNQDGNYTYIRVTAASNTNNVWIDATLGATMWHAWDNPGQARTASTYTEHRFGTGRGTVNEAVRILRGDISGYDSSGNVNFAIASGSGGITSNTYFNSGNVGIGSSSPPTKLYVVGTIRANGASGQVDADPSVGSFRFYDGTTFRGGYGTDAWATGGSAANLVTYLNGGSYYVYSTGTGSKVFTITSGGNFGMGTTSPATHVEIYSSAGANLDGTVVYGTTTDGLSLHNDASTNGYGSGLWFYNSGLPAGIASSRVNLGNWATDLRFYTHPASTTNQNTLYERMRINSEGAIGINDSSPSTSVGGPGLSVKGASYIQLAVKSTATSAGMEFIPSTGNNYELQSNPSGQFILYDRTNGAYRFMVGNGGYFGIGTQSAPTAPLSLVTGGNTIDGTFYSTFTINNTGSGTFARIRFDRSASGRWGLTHHSDDSFRLSNLNFNGGGTADDTCISVTNNSNVGFGTGSPLSSINNKGVHISRGGHTLLMIGDGSSVGGVLQSSDDIRRMFMGANIYDDVSNSWTQFSDANGYAAFDAISDGGNGGLARILVGSGSDSSYSGSNIFFEAYKDNSSSYLKLRTNTDNALYINNSGSVGIGTSSPSYTLDVSGTIHSTGIHYASSFYPAGNYDTPNAMVIAADTNWTFGASSNNSNIYWMQVKYYGTGDDSRGFRLYNANGGGITWRVNGAGTMYTVGDIVAYSSDRRLKDNITNIPNALDKVLSLNGVTFDWNDTAIDAGFIPKIRFGDAGVIAQEVQEVLPQAVDNAPFDWQEGKSRSGENYLTVKYEKIVPLLIESIKELSAQNKKLEQKCGDLEDLLNTMINNKNKD